MKTLTLASCIQQKMVTRILIGWILFGLLSTIVYVHYTPLVRIMQTNIQERMLEITEFEEETILTSDVCSVKHPSNLPQTSKKKKFYKRTLTNKQEEILRDLLKVFKATLEANNITYFMTAGTLLGSYMHHGLIPWDDDVDFLAPIREKPNFVKAFSKLKPKYIFKPRVSYSKFYSNESKPHTRGAPFAFPFVDVIFYKRNKDLALKELNFVYNNSMVFPLIERPYWDMKFPAPKKTEQYLKYRYKLEKCPTNTRNHSRQYNYRPSHLVVTPCNELYNAFPFVFRCTSHSGQFVNETLWIGQRMISWVASRNGVIVKSSKDVKRKRIVKEKTKKLKS